MDKSQKQFMCLFEKLNQKINDDLKVNINKIYDYFHEYKNN